MSYTQGLAVSSSVASGGPALLWKQESKVDVWGFSHWYIDALIDYDNNDEIWRFTRFYGHLETNKREETWTLLESLKHINQIPWLCVGDFNEITSSSKNAGGNIRQARQMDRFRRVIHHCAF